MSWGDTSLSSLLRNQEEIEALIVLLVLHKIGINDAAWWRVVDGLAISALNEHPLVDSLVDDDESDWRNTTDCVVDRLQGFLELGDLFVDDLLSHGFSDTVSVDEDLGWQIALVFIREALNGIDHASIEVLLDDLLILGLNDDV